MLSSSSNDEWFQVIYICTAQKRVTSCQVAHSTPSPPPLCLLAAVGPTTGRKELIHLKWSAILGSAMMQPLLGVQLSVVAMHTVMMYMLHIYLRMGMQRPTEADWWWVRLSKAETMKMSYFEECTRYLLATRRRRHCTGWQGTSIDKWNADDAVSVIGLCYVYGDFITVWRWRRRCYVKWLRRIV